MAKLTTPSHTCYIVYVNKDGVSTGQHCPRAAYRRDSQDRWACKQHNDKLSAQARVARTAALRPTRRA
jgi:hypothetical protein